MAAQDELEIIKNKINLVDLIGEYVSLKKAGRNFKALCPFHAEKTPSFMVSPERQIWKCFGCNEGGDLFGFLMKIENLDFPEALKVLAKRAGVKLQRYRPSDEERKRQLLYEINHLASEFYAHVLLKHPAGKKALDYILGRGIKRESLTLFKLGFAPNLWDGLQRFLVGRKKYRPEDLERAGLVIRGRRGFYDRFRGRLMFTLKDYRGQVAGFAGRVLDPAVKEAKYVNTPETEIYHKSSLLYGYIKTKEAIKKADEAILVEGELDLISSYQAGVENVLAIKGSALTPNQVGLIERLTKNITFALDSDPAGDAAARRGIEIADAAGMNLKVVQLREGKDPDEVAQKNPQLWRKLVQKAVPVYDYFLDSALSRFQAQTAAGKRKIGQELIPIFAQIQDEIVKAHYIHLLAEKLGVSEEAIIAQMKKTASQIRQKKQPIYQRQTLIAKGEGKTQREILEEHLLALAFQGGRWPFLKKKSVKKLIKTFRFVRLLEALNDYFKRAKTFKSDRLAKQLPAELKGVFNLLYLLDFGELTDDEEKLEKELAKTLVRLEKLDFKDQLKAIAAEIRVFEAKQEKTAQDKKQSKKLEESFRDLSQKLASLDIKDEFRARK